MSRNLYPRLTLYDPNESNENQGEYKQLGLFNLLYALENSQFPMARMY